MLEELAKKDSYWRKVAYNICKDRLIADDLVQDMYLIFYDFTPKKEINDWYIVITIRNLYLLNKKKDSIFKSLSEIDKPEEQKIFEYDYKTLEELKQEETIKDLKWWERELIEMTHDYSFHEIQRQTNFNYQFVRRTLIKAKQNGKTKKAK